MITKEEKIRILEMLLDLRFFRTKNNPSRIDLAFIDEIDEMYLKLVKEWEF